MKPTTRAPKPNQHERVQRHTTIDNLITRALRGVLTIPEAAVLAEYWRAERRNAEQTRRSLGDTTRALQRHREAADAEVQRLEAQIAELLAAAEAPAQGGEGAGEAAGGAVGAPGAVGGAPVVQGAARAADGRTAPEGRQAAWEPPGRPTPQPDHQRPPDGHTATKETAA